MSKSKDEQITSTDRQQVDGTQLVDQIGIDRQEIEWRKQFRNFDEADKQRLTTLESVVDPVIDEAVEGFYSVSKAKARPFTGVDEADNWESIHGTELSRSFISNQHVGMTTPRRFRRPIKRIISGADHTTSEGIPFGPLAVDSN